MRTFIKDYFLIKDMKKYPNHNLNAKPLIDCLACGERKESHAKGLCYSCYKKQWKSKPIICKECGRKRPHKAFGLCDGCHNRIHHYGNVKRYNAKKYHNISLEEYDKLTQSCKVCGFKKIVELHHLDGDNSNALASNMVGLCPNCHKMIHSFEFYGEIKNALKSKGFDVLKVHPSNYVYRKDESKQH